MRHMKSGRTFNRDTNARKAMFIGLAKNLIEKEQIKTTLPKAKDLRSVVEKLITRAKTDTVANRRLVASELGNSSAATVKKLFTVLGPRYANRPGGYTRVLKAGFRYGDAAPMAIIELVDRDENAKKVVKPAAADENKASDAVADKAEKKAKTTKAATSKAAAKEKSDEDSNSEKKAGAKKTTEKKPSARRRAAAK